MVQTNSNVDWFYNKVIPIQVFTNGKLHVEQFKVEYHHTNA